MTPYDQWKFASPDDERHEIGTEYGQTCGRYSEPDEDAPRGHKPKPCKGEMEPVFHNAAASVTGHADWIECDTCGEIA